MSMLALSNSAQKAPQRLTYKQRAELTTHPVAKKLCTIIHEKQSNIALAADVTSKAALLELADRVGPEICCLKTHIDIIQDFDWDLVVQLQQLAKKHNFLIVEDRKFADIGSTVRQQYEGGTYRIAQWADIIIAHTIAGKQTITALLQAAAQRERALLLIAQLSCADNMITNEYTQQVVAMAREFPNFVIGLIAQESVTDDPSLLICTPGIHCAQTSDESNQRYNDPEWAIAQGSDILIIGRAIYQALDPQAAARDYRTRAWRAYQQRLTTLE